MTDVNVPLEDLLDSLKDPFVFCDTSHVIRYMNRAARERYAGKPAEIGRSIFDCHNDASNAQIIQIVTDFGHGGDEELITDDERHRIYLRAVRDTDGKLLGYYERYEPPR